MYVPVYGPSEPNYGPGGGFHRPIIGYTPVRITGGSSGGSSPTYRTQYTTTCTGGAPGKPGTPGQFERVAGGPDWQASARSIRRVSGDIVASFDVNASPRAAVGLATNDTGPSFADLRMGVLLRRTGVVSAIHPLINGEELAQVGYFIPGDRVHLLRAGGRFRIQVGTEVVFDAPAPTDQSVVLDAMLYTSDDFVENPAFGTVAIGMGVRSHVGYSARLSSVTSARARVGLTGAAGTLVDGVALSRARGRVGFVGATTLVPNDRVSASGRVGFVGKLGGLADWAGVNSTLPALAGVASDRAYTQIYSVLPGLQGSAAGGTPTQEVAGGDLSLPAFGFYALSHTGGLLTLEQELPSFAGMASDRPYGQAQLTLPVPRMYADDGVTYPGFTFHLENLELRDELVPDPTLFASIQFGLELEPSLSLGTLVQGSFFEGLILDPLLSIDAYIHALIQSGVNLSSATQAPKEGFGQYGFDLDTAAATRYEGFDFRGFAYTGEDTFAFRKDGVFRLRAGDDDGELRSALVDFGVTGMGAMGKKHIETVFLGMGTDGRVYLKLTGDGAPEKTYRVIQRDPTYRVLTGRGLTAREWGAKLEVVDSSEIELEEVEFVVAATGRKWGR